MPLTTFQSNISQLLAPNRSPDSYLAGGAALHLSPNSKRYSNDLDYFHDSEERVARAFADDSTALTDAGYRVEMEMNQPGYIRAIVSKGKQRTKIEWAHDSAWRFMPPVKDKLIGYRLDPVDIAINKVLALAGRDEARDFLDIIYIHQNILPLGPLCWAACGKDPGFSPKSLLELIKRRGRYQPEDFERLHLAEKVDLQALKSTWLEALREAEDFVATQTPAEVGCLYYSLAKNRFVSPRVESDAVPHFGRPGGVIPNFTAKS